MSKSKTVSVSIRISPRIKSLASQKLAQSGLTMSEFLRVCLINVADYDLADFLSSPEALQAKEEVMNGHVTAFKSLDDLWADINDEK
ncbi:type II toxin-antitoxin system RelB/DinJ family antitoxin [Levilactobacillus andaensis]|uniref:type II toxin-antitoxin system RelB/DinJ family antitoxin n=1 Tax=Levilactobacillus andaensis TaxID=2799570 RepID=UPI001942AD83|nr:type II toxin-antitoxin system RelB/DinJ family antitoxin [Levilactobacillus andaensis]